MKKDDELFKIKEFSLFKNVLRIVLIGWIIFAIYKFNINQYFFGITILIAVVLIILISEMVLEAKENYIQICNNRWFRIFSSTFKAKYKDIELIYYEKSTINYVIFILTLIDGMAGTDDIAKNDAKLYIKFKNGEVKEFYTIGNKNQNAKLINIVLSQIKKIR